MVGGIPSQWGWGWGMVFQIVLMGGWNSLSVGGWVGGCDFSFLAGGKGGRGGEKSMKLK